MSSLERRALPRRQGVPVDVEDHGDDRVVPAGRDQVDDPLLAEALDGGLERGIGDGLVAEQLRAEIVDDALIVGHRRWPAVLRDRVDDRVGEARGARESAVRPELVLRPPEAAGDQDGHLVQRGRDRGLEADVLADLLHAIGHLGAVQQRVEGPAGALARARHDALVALALARGHGGFGEQREAGTVGRVVGGHRYPPRGVSGGPSIPRYVGRYRVAWNGQIHECPVTLEDGTLVLHDLLWPANRLIWKEANVFYAESWPVELIFEQDAQGTIRSLTTRV